MYQARLTAESISVQNIHEANSAKSASLNKS